MSATQELIAAALTAADELDVLTEQWLQPKSPTGQWLREACARAMVQPGIPEVERLVREFEGAVWDQAVHGISDANTTRAALLDAVRAIVAERDQFRDAAKMVPGGWPCEIIEADFEHNTVTLKMNHYGYIVGAGPHYLVPAAAAPQPVGEVQTGHAEADPIIGRLMSSDPDFQDCADAARLIQQEIKGPDGFATWRDAAIAERIKRAQPGGEVPMPEPEDVAPFCGQRIYAFTRDQLRNYGVACHQQGYAAGVAAERERTLNQCIAHIGTIDDGESPAYRHCQEALSALRGEVK